LSERRLASTDRFQQITEMIGSGPLKFAKEEFEPGHRVVYLKNTDYVPRSEPPSWASGGKVVRVDRVEWLNGGRSLPAGAVDQDRGQERAMAGKQDALFQFRRAEPGTS
jgi:hypothetical protein